MNRHGAVWNPARPVLPGVIVAAVLMLAACGPGGVVASAVKARVPESGAASRAARVALCGTRAVRDCARLRQPVTPEGSQRW